MPFRIKPVFAAVSVTTATGGSSISADSTGGSYTSLTGPIISEGANRDFPASGTFILSAPSGFVFNTGSTVTATINRIAGAKTCFTFTSTTATPTTSTITFTLNAQDGTGGNPPTICRVTFSGIQVRPSAGTPLASGNITDSGTATITGLTSSTNLGTLTETFGAKNKLTITQQPAASATINTDFSTKPVVAIQDQFGNTVTNDNTSTVTRSVVLATQSCGGTAGAGTLTSTPGSGAAVSSGLMTYTAMQYSVVESIKICFTSSGITSALSNAINVLSLPTVTTQATGNIKSTTATGNGNITVSGGENADKRGFVYSTASHSLPGNVAPTSSGYESYAEDTGSFTTGAFTKGLTGLSGGTPYYVRSYTHNSIGYSYGGEVNFTTAIISISITSNGVVSYGIVPVNTYKDTTASGLNNTQTATNVSTIAEDFSIKSSDATGGTTWTLSNVSNGANQYMHKFSTNSGGSWTPMSTTYTTLATNIAASGFQDFDLQILTPTVSSDFTQKAITITIQAVEY